MHHCSAKFYTSLLSFDELALKRPNPARRVVETTAGDVNG